MLKCTCKYLVGLENILLSVTVYGFRCARYIRPDPEQSILTSRLPTQLISTDYLKKYFSAYLQSKVVTSLLTVPNDLCHKRAVSLHNKKSGILRQMASQLNGQFKIFECICRLHFHSGQFLVGKTAEHHAYLGSSIVG